MTLRGSVSVLVALPLWLVLGLVLLGAAVLIVVDRWIRSLERVS